MPYNNLNDSMLPSYIKKLPENIRKKWVSIFNTAYEKYGEKKAIIISNKWLKTTITKKETVAKTEKTLSLIKFEVDDSKELIKKADNGEEYIDFIMADNEKDSAGDSYPETLLTKWAKQINSGDVILGDLDHEEYDRLIKAGYSVDEVMAKLKEKKGIAKTLKAIVQKGKLWVRAIIDKRYKKVIKEKAKGVSLEALVTRDESGNIKDGDLGGFTFGVGCNPVNDRAVIV